MRKVERVISEYGLEPAISRSPDLFRYLISRFRYGKWISDLQRLRHSITEDGYTLEGFEQKNCIFVHIPKCAGISVTDALFGNRAGSHVPLYMYLALYGARKFDEMFKFTFVRNPWDRISSAYFFLKKGGMTRTDSEWSRKWLSRCDSLDHFVQEVLPNPMVREMDHFRTQTYFLIDPRTGTIGCDFIGRFECMEKDFDTVASKLQVKNRLARLNSAETRRSWRDEMSPVSIRTIEKLYADDVRNFNYDRAKDEAAS